MNTKQKTRIIKISLIALHRAIRHEDKTLRVANKKLERAENKLLRARVALQKHDDNQKRIRLMAK